MNKEQLMKGIEAVDDELITEAASSRSKGIKYRTKVKITRFAMVTAVAAVMVTTGGLMHLNSKKAPEPEKFSTAAVTESSTTAETSAAAVTVTTNENYQAVTQTAVVTDGATVIADTPATVTTSIQYSTLAETTTRTGTADTATSSQTTTTTTADEPHETVTVPAEREFIYNRRTGEIYEPMQNYVWGEDKNIVNVQYGTAVTRDKGIWINCDPGQADTILDSINELQSEKALRRDIIGGGFCVKIIYADGKTAEYEFMGEDYYIVTGTDGLTFTYTDKGNVAKNLTWYLENEFISMERNAAIKSW